MKENPIASIAKGLVSPVTNYLGKREDRKQAIAEGQTQLAVAKAQGKSKVEMAVSQWELLMAKLTAESLKDEVVTGVVLTPFILVQVGAVWLAITGNSTLFDASRLIFTTFEEAGINYGFIATTVVLAAIGLKWKRAQ